MKLADVNREVAKIELGLDIDYSLQHGACEAQVLEGIRRGYLAGLARAAKMVTGPRKIWHISLFAKGYDVGHDAHVRAIRDLVRAIRKEMGR